MAEHITAERFRKAVGREPQQDDLERCNCIKAGRIGHNQCGWSIDYDLPRFLTPEIITIRELGT